MRLHPSGISFNKFTRRVYGAGLNAVAKDPLLPTILKKQIRFRYSKCIAQSALIDFHRRKSGTVSDKSPLNWHRFINDFCSHLIQADLYKRDIESKLEHAQIKNLTKLKNGKKAKHTLTLALDLISFDLQWLYEPWIENGIARMSLTDSAKDFFHILGRCISNEHRKNRMTKTHRTTRVKRILAFVRRRIEFKQTVLPPSRDNVLIFKSDEGKPITDHGKLLMQLQLNGLDTGRNSYTAKTLKNLLHDNGIYLNTENKKNDYLRAIEKEKIRHKAQVKQLSQLLAPLIKS